MKNIDWYQGDSFDFYQKIVGNKRKSDAVSILTDIQDEIEIKYKTYDDIFSNNKLENVSKHPFSRLEDKLLLSLYSSQNAEIQRLKLKLTTDSNNNKWSTCPHCTVGEVNSLDHFCSKKELPEFAIHPKNLIPMCSKCNSYKGATWRNGNKRTSLNLYTDILPNIPYLFADVSINNNKITDIRFYLKKHPNMNSSLFELLENHYKELKLFSRFKDDSHEVISSLDNEIRQYLDLLSYSQIKGITLKKYEVERKQFGYNYWKTVLKLALINNLKFEKIYST